jgi:hypothetical protein
VVDLYQVDFTEAPKMADVDAVRIEDVSNEGARYGAPALMTRSSLPTWIQNMHWAPLIVPDTPRWQTSKPNSMTWFFWKMVGFFFTGAAAGAASSAGLSMTTHKSRGKNDDGNLYPLGLPGRKTTFLVNNFLFFAFLYEYFYP